MIDYCPLCGMDGVKEVRENVFDCSFCEYRFVLKYAQLVVEGPIEDCEKEACLTIDQDDIFIIFGFFLGVFLTLFVMLLIPDRGPTNTYIMNMTNVDEFCDQAKTVCKPYYNEKIVDETLGEITPCPYDEHKWCLKSRLTNTTYGELVSNR